MLGNRRSTMGMLVSGDGIAPPDVPFMDEVNYLCFTPSCASIAEIGRRRWEQVITTGAICPR